MILFIRNQDNNTIAEVECYVDTGDNDYRFVELHASVDVMYYSLFLLENLDKADQIISTFSDIQELRGWLWEVYFMGGNNDPEKYDDVLAELRKMLKRVAEKYDLCYVED